MRAGWLSKCCLDLAWKTCSKPLSSNSCNVWRLCTCAVELVGSGIMCGLWGAAVSQSQQGRVETGTSTSLSSSVWSIGKSCGIGRLRYPQSALCCASVCSD